MDHLRSEVRDQLDQHGETLSLLKIQKLAGSGGVCLYSQLLTKLRQENRLNPGGRGCHEPRLCHCIPAWATRVKLHLKKKKKKNCRNQVPLGGKETVFLHFTVVIYSIFKI